MMYGRVKKQVEKSWFLWKIIVAFLPKL